MIKSSQKRGNYSLTKLYIQCLIRLGANFKGREFKQFLWKVNTLQYEYIASAVLAVILVLLK